MAMRFSREDADNLAQSLRKALQDRAMSAALLARQTGVHPSRISRFLHGKFATNNPELMQICTFLGVSTSAGTDVDPAARIVASALRIWDGTPEDANEVVTLLEQLARVRRRPLR